MLEFSDSDLETLLVKTFIYYFWRNKQSVVLPCFKNTEWTWGVMGRGTD